MVKNIKNPKVEGRQRSIKQHLELALGLSVCLIQNCEVTPGQRDLLLTQTILQFSIKLYVRLRCAGWEWGETLRDKI